MQAKPVLAAFCASAEGRVARLKALFLALQVRFCRGAFVARKAFPGCSLQWPGAFPGFGLFLRWRLARAGKLAKILFVASLLASQSGAVVSVLGSQPDFFSRALRCLSLLARVDSDCGPCCGLMDKALCLRNQTLQVRVLLRGQANRTCHASSQPRVTHAHMQQMRPERFELPTQPSDLESLLRH